MAKLRTTKKNTPIEKEKRVKKPMISTVNREIRYANVIKSSVVWAFHSFLEDVLYYEEDEYDGALKYAKQKAEERKKHYVNK